MLYSSNFDDSQFKDVNWREFNRTIDDPCALQKRGEDNEKKLKFVTTNHIDLIEAKENLNFYGMTIKDQLFVPSENMDKDSFLRYGQTGNVLTNCNVKNIFGQLPFPTVPAKYQTGHGNLEVSDKMRIPVYEGHRQSNIPREDDIYKRSFSLFENIEKPDATKSIETPEFGPRGGVNTRFLPKQKK